MPLCWPKCLNTAAAAPYLFRIRQHRQKVCQHLNIPRWGNNHKDEHPITVCRVTLDRQPCRARIHRLSASRETM